MTAQESRPLLAARVVRAWCLCAAIGVVVAIVADAYAVEWHGGGRVVIALLCVAHLLVVPWLGRIDWSRGLMEAALFGAFAAPLAEVSRQMAGAASMRLVTVCAAMGGAHVVGLLASRLTPAARRLIYHPAIVALAAWPLVAYVLAEFFRVTTEGFAEGGPLAWVAEQLDAPQ